MLSSYDSPLQGRPLASPPRNLMAMLSTYRLLIAMLLLVMFHIELGDRLVGDQRPTLFLTALLVYTVGNTAMLSVSMNRNQGNSIALLFTAALLDILTINLLLQAGGTQSRPLSLLFIIAIFGTATVLPGRLSLLVAALCTLSVLAQAALRVYRQQSEVVELLHSGILGVVFFAAAVAVRQLMRRASAHELLARQQAEDIRELQQLNEKIVRRMRTGIIVMNGRGQVQLINDSARMLLGLAAEPPTLIGQAVPAVLMNAWRDWRHNPQHLPRPFQTHAGGATLQASFSALSRGDFEQCLTFLEDTRLVAQQAQSLKLESLGRLTASIAHEIRNPLGAISHAAELLGESTTLSLEDQRFSRIITSQSARVNQVIQNVLNLSRKQDIKPRQLDLIGHLREFIRQYREQAGGCPDIRLDSAISSIAITFDPSQLDQVLTNLFDNGLRYSYQHTGRRTLTVIAGNDPDSGLPLLDIIDQGSGIPADKLPKIFEPFYTTEGQGTGLGLYLAREICEAHQTQLIYLGIDGEQSCFRLVFAHPNKRWLP